MRVARWPHVVNAGLLSLLGVIVYSIASEVAWHGYDSHFSLDPNLPDYYAPARLYYWLVVLGLPALMVGLIVGTIARGFRMNVFVVSGLSLVGGNCTFYNYDIHTVSQLLLTEEFGFQIGVVFIMGGCMNLLAALVGRVNAAKARLPDKSDHETATIRL